MFTYAEISAGDAERNKQLARIADALEAIAGKPAEHATGRSFGYSWGEPPTPGGCVAIEHPEAYDCHPGICGGPFDSGSGI